MTILFFLAIFLFSLLNISEYLFSTSKKIVKFLQSLLSKFQAPNKSFRPGFKPSRQFEITALDLTNVSKLYRA